MKNFTLFLLLLTAFVLPAQNQLSKWYFGKHAALDFMTNPPTVLNNSAMNNGVGGSVEGSSSIADAAGNLLFYTNGETVWNSQHTIMANGTGLFGSLSSVQSSMIIKHSVNPNLYYIFTMDCCGTSGSGNDFNYSVVDMSLAAGLGSVTVKNAPIYNAPCTEQLNATKHANGVDCWIMIHELNSNNFRAYLLTATGLNTTAVVSSVGTTVNYNGFMGTIKFSPTAQKIASVLNSGGGLIELYDFDNITGVVSNPLNLGSGKSSYGCEFSADGTKFYAGGTNLAFHLTQWDLNAGSNAAIFSSSVVVAPNVPGCNGMQLAPNGKIYIVVNNGTGSLSVINSPNAVGTACNFTLNGQLFSVAAINATPVVNSSATYGTPNMLVAGGCIFNYGLQLSNTVVCNSSDVVSANIVNVIGNQGNINYLWSNGSNTYTSPQINALPIGNWTVIVTDEAGCQRKKLFTVSQTTTALSITASNANPCGSGSPVTLSAGGATTYTWSTGSQAQSIIVSPTINTQYSVSTTDEYDCVLSNTITINPLSAPEISLNTNSGNYIACVGDTLILNASGASSYAWSANGNFIASTQTLAVAPLHNTTYYVTGIAQNGCESLSVPVSVTVAPPPALSVSGSTIYCSAQIVTLTASGAYNYYWQWGGAHAHASSSTIVLKQGVTTQYTLTGTNEYGCKSTEVVTVTIGCVGIDKFEIGSEKFEVYPNPASQMLNVESPPSLKGGTVEIYVYDVLGNVILNEKLNIENNVAQINVSALKSGMYFLKIGNATRKFVKE
ncbi:MAG: T9SS type A sorting domain-containing protein [Bacteroidetes bacterium]|nr:T9SS type A sorting domain-containing protein [Bacteroidota bacterium]